MTRHDVYDVTGTKILAEIDIDKGVTAEELVTVHGLSRGVQYRLRATSALSPVFIIPALASPYTVGADYDGIIESVTANDDGTTTIALSGGTPSGHFDVATAALDAMQDTGLPVFMTAPTITQDPVGTFRINDDALVIYPTGDVPTFLPFFDKEGFLVSDDSRQYTLQSGDENREIGANVRATNSAGDALHRTVIQEAEAFDESVLQYTDVSLSNTVGSNQPDFTSFVQFYSLVGTTSDSAQLLDTGNGTMWALVNASGTLQARAKTGDGDVSFSATSPAPLDTQSRFNIFVVGEAGGALSVWVSVDGSTPVVGFERSLPAGVFNLSDTVLSFFSGVNGFSTTTAKFARIALKVGNVTTPVVNDQAFFGEFFKSDGTLHPPSRAEQFFGGLDVDIYGPAADLAAAGYNRGTLGNFALNAGTIEDATT